MKKLQGYKTIIAGCAGILFSVLQANGILVPEADQAAIELGLASVAAIMLRFSTSGKVGEKT